MVEPAPPRTLREIVSAGPLPVGRAVRIAISLADLMEERLAASATRAFDRLDLDDVTVAEEGEGAPRVDLRRPAQEGDGPPAPDSPPGPGARTIPAVRAAARLLCRALGGDPDAGDAALRFPEGLPGEVRPLLSRALDPDSPAPVATLGTLREALLDVAHMDRSPVGHAPAGIPSAIVRKVQLDVRGDSGKRHAAWCWTRLEGGGTGQAVLLVDPSSRDLAHHERTLRCLWPGAEIGAWNLPPPSERSRGDLLVFDLPAETILVVEPLRTFEVTAIAAAHEVSCPLHFLVALRSGAGDVSPALLAGRMADAALAALLARTGARDAAVVREALAACRDDEAWIRTDAGVERAEAGLRSNVPRIRAWLDRRGIGPSAMGEVTVVARRFGFVGRCDVVDPRAGTAPFVGEMKSGHAQASGAPDPARGAASAADLRGSHVAQARLYALAWTDAIRQGASAAGGGEPGVVETELFYAASDAAWRIRPAARELATALSTRNAMLDLLRRTAEGLGPAPGPSGVESCDRCWRRDQCTLGGGAPDPSAAVPLDDAARRSLAAYVAHFDRALVRTVWHSQGAHREQIETDRLDVRVASMTAERDLSLEPDPSDPRTAWLVGSHRAVFQRGARVVVHRGDPAAVDALRCDLAEILPDRYRLGLAHALPPWTRCGPDWIVEEDRRVETAREGFEGLSRLLHRRDPDLVRTLLVPADRERPEPARDAPAIPACPFPRGWHPSQVEAFARAISGGPIEPVQGPPGTGKTVFIGALVGALVAAGRRVLVGALTHGAADLVARRIVEMGVRDLLRVGARGRSDGLVEALRLAGLDPARVYWEEFARAAPDAASARARLLGAPVLVATCHRIGRMPWRSTFRPGGKPPFDVAVLDEATQIPEPLALAAIALAKRAVLVGDPCQLSCVVPAESDRPPVQPADPALAAAGILGLGRSLHERLCSTRGASMLREQHRMHERIMAFSNRRFYGGALEASPEARDRKLEIDPARCGMLPAWLDAAVRPDEPLVLVDVAGGSDGRRNPREADLVARTASELVRAGLAPSDIGVVTPYRAQVALVRKTLASDPSLGAVLVDTVERFQGDEREAVLVSLVGGRPTGHLAHPNRLNVTFTRARRKLVVFGDAEGLSRDPLLRELVTQPETTRVRP